MINFYLTTNPQNLSNWKEYNHQPVQYHQNVQMTARFTENTQLKFANEEMT